MSNDPLRTRRIGVCVSDPESEQIDRLAAYWNTSRAAVVHRALRQYLAVWTVRDLQVEVCPRS